MSSQTEPTPPEIVGPAEHGPMCSPKRYIGMDFRSCQDHLRLLVRSSQLAPLLGPLHNKMYSTPCPMGPAHKEMVASRPRMSISCRNCGEAEQYRSYFELNQVWSRPAFASALSPCGYWLADSCFVCLPDQSRQGSGCVVISCPRCRKWRRPSPTNSFMPMTCVQEVLPGWRGE